MIRARGAFAAEHIFTALPTSPARMHFCIVARKTSLLIDEPNRKRARSTMMPIVRIDQKRMGHIPHPPSLKCSYAPCILVVLQFASRLSHLEVPRAFTTGLETLLVYRSCSA